MRWLSETQPKSDVEAPKKEPDREPEPFGWAFMRGSLIKLAKARDEMAWFRLMREFISPIDAWVARTGLPFEDRRDVTQEVAIALFRHIAEFDDDMAPATLVKWLKTTARNKVIDKFREPRVEREAAGGSWARDRLAAVPDPRLSANAALAAAESHRRALEREAVRRSGRCRRKNLACILASYGR